ncbi:MAG: phenylalanine--tRNA ligase subunit beta [Acidobacteria bacterium]|nr:MAG: phenylalanine--tRNA ligase subunit beta [Acidobacteriota bacterium]REK01606.1 MAG: phenylalanine--tRNA ligase subunit beta [Acidobacteriota bacterium]REK14562.1 MAG: phenylalanine--tRNA ligase subunit beta [Acidobacteriota bacterium]REK45277.1 MAG: phenylalanine--tRNA ligase subunit beta [Acidobacteriota bacterium]
MNISYKWLQDLVDLDLPAEKLAEKLTLIGLELDGLHQAGDDWVLDIETTSNRGDCLSHLGVAREVSVSTRRSLRLPESELPHEEPDRDLVSIDDPDLCHRFTARIIRNVKIGPSPDWLVRRLEAVGERPINNIADITNYAMHTLGQPMHAFDLDKLAEGRIIVRRAKQGESLVTLDEVERKLDGSMLAICDAEKPLAVGGVMGGFESGIGEDTVNVLLEVACFDSLSIRSTSRELGLSTEASYRFERGVDIENLVRASDFASDLIAELAGGEIGEFADVYPTKREPARIDAPELRSEVLRLSGLDVSQDEIERILSDLGIEKLSADSYRSPTWRHDLAIEEDLVEEVVRIAGYDTIGEELPSGGSAGEYQPSEERKRRLRGALSTLGYSEAISYSFIDSGHQGVFASVPSLGTSESGDFVEIRDPIIEGASMMRPSLLPGILDAVKVNFNHRNRDLKLFEIGKVFVPEANETGLPLEKELLSICITGSELLSDRENAVRKMDFYDLKGALELVFDSLRIERPQLRPCKVSHLQAGQSAEVLEGGSVVGYVGKVNDGVSAGYKFKQPVFVAEIDLESLLKKSEEPPAYTSLPVYPSVQRDVTMAIKRSVSYGDVRQAITGQGFELLRNVSYVDVFEGQGLAEGERAVTIRLDYRSDERTLTEEEVDSVHSEILKNLASDIDFELR